MTPIEMIELVDSLVPNGIGQSVKMGWLNDCETQIYQDVFLTHEGTDQLQFSGYGAETDQETKLLVGAPHHMVYRWYLEMMIHGTNQETAKYNNAATMYNAALIALMDYYNRAYRPKGVTTLKYW